MKHCRNILTCSSNIGKLIILTMLIFCSGCSTRVTPSEDLAFDHLMQGDADRKQNNYPAALQEYQTAIAISPNNWPAHSKAGQMLEQEGKFQEAILQYRKVIAIDHTLKNPADKAWWHFRLAGALSKAGLYQDAANEYKLTLNLASQDQTHNKKLESLVKKVLVLCRRA